MKLPNHAKPVFRTVIGRIKDSEQPRTVVDIRHTSDDCLNQVRSTLYLGANYNAPMRFLTPVDYCGCHILSGSSMAMCLAACGML
ncbi:MAG: hypothetical protein QNJ55_10510 [Xenococcus sp. MO_188.B8]|nr:hypothetical protein [Xenococcus sp. MO_188.B8]